MNHMNINNARITTIHVEEQAVKERLQHGELKGKEPANTGARNVEATLDQRHTDFPRRKIELN